MVVGNQQCNAANLNQSKTQLQLGLSLAQFSPSLLLQFSQVLSNSVYFGNHSAPQLIQVLELFRHFDVCITFVSTLMFLNF